MFNNLLNWFLNLWGVVSTPPTPPVTGTVGNHNTIPETSNPNHTHLNLKVDHVNVDDEPVVMPMFQSLVVIPKGGVLTKDDIIDSVVSVEGGYVNNPDDSGGETNFGITLTVAKTYEKALKEKFNWNGTMKSFTKPMAKYIYEIEYWAKLKLDDIYKTSPFLADKLFDLGVNVGKVRAAKWLQEALNVFNRKAADYKDIGVDGGIGKETLTALDALIKVRGKDKAIKTLLKALITRQGAHYQQIALDNEKNETFMFGWFDRLERHLDLYLN